MTKKLTVTDYGPNGVDGKRIVDEIYDAALWSEPETAEKRTARLEGLARLQVNMLAASLREAADGRTDADRSLQGRWGSMWARANSREGLTVTRLNLALIAALGGLALIVWWALQ